MSSLLGEGRGAKFLFQNRSEAHGWEGGSLEVPPSQVMEKHRSPMETQTLQQHTLGQPCQSREVTEKAGRKRRTDVPDASRCPRTAIAVRLTEFIDLLCYLMQLRRYFLFLLPVCY